MLEYVIPSIVLIGVVLLFLAGGFFGHKRFIKKNPEIFKRKEYEKAKKSAIKLDPKIKSKEEVLIKQIEKRDLKTQERTSLRIGLGFWTVCGLLFIVFVFDPDPTFITITIILGGFIGTGNLANYLYSLRKFQALLNAKDKDDLKKYEEGYILTNERWIGKDFSNITVKVKKEVEESSYFSRKFDMIKFELSGVDYFYAWVLDQEAENYSITFTKGKGNIEEDMVLFIIYPLKRSDIENILKKLSGSGFVEELKVPEEKYMEMEIIPEEIIDNPIFKYRNARNSLT